MSALLSGDEAAVVLAVSRSMVRQWVAQGLLTEVSGGEHQQFRRDQVQLLRACRLEQSLTNRHRAEAERAAVVASGVDIDVPPTPQEMALMGAALRRGDRSTALPVLVRARRAAARRAAWDAAT